ncbi:Zn-dependent M28 family amino/carboxypeptidase [Sphingomonas kyeonggiensis]|uniref:Zn-dependent M28 family amino/carboxypeptidase n=1 Tax=Sphingomonas kyeonggiensis TaxID=1268553 RepID=A0A7W7JYM0_9SPHN|nr:M28 family metallopeptidase [Sphingomonas kyeonggiensis]MBB4837160.1 Zn-dependent M28 family amino/carboxypeptidase [Sphingomonas kyeonggiensis]
MRHLLTVALLLSGTAANAQTIPVETMKEVTQVLSSDAYEGRAPTTPAEDKTIAYIVQRFEKAGLKPGNKGQWTQDVPLVEITAKDVAPLVFTGGKQAVSLDYRKDMVIATYRVVPKVAIKDSDVVFVGYGINAPERGWNDYAGLDVKGKTVVILVNDPDYKTPETKGLFDGKAMTYYGRWTYKFEEAARQGAAAAIIVHDTYPAAYPWGVVQSSWTGPQLEQDTPGDHMDQSQAIGWMQLDKAKALFAAAGKDFDALSAAAAQKGFKAVPLGVKASVGWENTIKRQASKNVVGVLPGTAKPDEVVLYSAHWDHLGRCDAVNGDDICNGAVDNASGIGGLVALAEAHAKAGPAKRSLVFLAVTAEESGLLGSKFYAENPVYPLAKTVGGVNMDSLNVIGKTKDFVIAGAGKSELEDLVKPFVAAEGRVIVPEARPEAGGYYRSDHFSFAKLGVPMLYGESGDDLVNGGKEAGEKAAKDYTQNRYHKPQDEYNPAWDWSGSVSDLNIYYGLGRQLAEGSAWPNWYKTAEFRAVRDKSRAGQ